MHVVACISNEEQDWQFYLLFIVVVVEAFFYNKKASRRAVYAEAHTSCPTRELQ